jgi:UDP-N-acetylmuramoyl-L-alanyl-D-glutamate--2,6-diaminopimelate ligase
MLWPDLIAEITAVGTAGSAAQPITGIEYDSRRVHPGSVFVAMKGGTTDGNRYINKAIAAGATGIITDSSPTFDHLVVYKPEIALAEVEHGRRALAEASTAFFGHP